MPIETQCAECPIGHVREFETEDQAYGAGWLSMRTESRRFWLCPSHAGHSGRLLVREGLSEGDVVREGRIRE